MCITARAAARDRALAPAFIRSKNSAAQLRVHPLRPLAVAVLLDLLLRGGSIKSAVFRAAVEAFSAPERGLCSNGLNAHNVSVRGVTHRSAGVAMLYKWFVVGLSEYELIIFADLDVALLRPEQPADAVRARWRSHAR